MTLKEAARELVRAQAAEVEAKSRLAAAEEAVVVARESTDRAFRNLGRALAKAEAE